MDYFVPDFSELEKSLIVDGKPVNDIAFFNAIKGTSMEGLGQGIVVDQSDPNSANFFAEGLNDDALFESVIPKELQSPVELASYGDALALEFNDN